MPQAVDNGVTAGRFDVRDLRSKGHGVSSGVRSRRLLGRSVLAAPLRARLSPSFEARASALAAQDDACWARGLGGSLSARCAAGLRLPGADAVHRASADGGVAPRWRLEGAVGSASRFA